MHVLNTQLSLWDVEGGRRPHVIIEYFWNAFFFGLAEPNFFICFGSSTGKNRH